MLVSVVIHAVLVFFRALLAMDNFQRYMRQYGMLLTVYVDKHTTYRSPAEPTVEDQLSACSPRVSLAERYTSWGSN
jgi:hypothetical protein